MFTHPLSLGRRLRIGFGALIGVYFAITLGALVWQVAASWPMRILAIACSSLGLTVVLYLIEEEHKRLNPSFQGSHTQRFLQMFDLDHGYRDQVLPFYGAGLALGITLAVFTIIWSF